MVKTAEDGPIAATDNGVSLHTFKRTLCIIHLQHNPLVVRVIIVVVVVINIIIFLN